MSDEILIGDDGEMMLFFDDDGEDLYIGDCVLVNHETETKIEGNNEHRWLKGFPPNVVVDSIERISPPLEDRWPDEVN